MIPELMEMAKAGTLDLAAREDMGLMSLESDEREFLDLVCEIASEHVPAPADKSIESFDILVGAIIGAFFSYKAYEVLRKLEGLE